MNNRKAKEYVARHATTMSILTDKPYTWVSMRIVYGNQPYGAIGCAKCEPADEREWKPETGIEYAQKRARRSLAKQIVARAWQEEAAMNGKGGLALTIAGLPEHSMPRETIDEMQYKLAIAWLARDKEKLNKATRTAFLHERKWDSLSKSNPGEGPAGLRGR